MPKEIKSSVYGVAKDSKGKCILIKKKRVKPKPKVKVEKTTIAQVIPQQNLSVINKALEEAKLKKLNPKTEIDTSKISKQDVTNQANAEIAKLKALDKKTKPKPKPGTPITPSKEIVEAFDKERESLKKFKERMKALEEEEEKEEEKLTKRELLRKVKKYYLEHRLPIEKTKWDDLDNETKSDYFKEFVKAEKYEEQKPLKGVVYYVKPPSYSESSQKGKGNDDGLYESDIEKIMDSGYFEGAIAADEIKDLAIKPKMCFISNTSKRSDPNAGVHWVATYLDSVKNKEISYYDPFGKEPSEEYKIQMAEYIKKLNPKHLLKFKINSVKNQNVNSSNCGWHCINFLNKMIGGSDFKTATGYKEPEIDNSNKMEAEAEALKKKFGYL